MRDISHFCFLNKPSLTNIVWSAVNN